MGKINDTIATVKTGLDVQVHLATAEEKERLADAKLALADIKLEVAELKSRINDLEDKLRIKDNFILNRGVRWSIEDEAENQPYCPVCYSANRIIPLQKDWDGAPKEGTRWHCPEKTCSASYNPWDFKEEDSTSFGESHGSLFSLHDRY